MVVVDGILGIPGDASRVAAACSAPLRASRRCDVGSHYAKSDNKC